MSNKKIIGKERAKDGHGQRQGIKVSKEVYLENLYQLQIISEKQYL
jgi:hypothetical protein